ncbi:MAG: VOC family protein [bacterium]
MSDSTDLVTDPTDDARRDIDPLMDVGIASPGWRLPVATRVGHVALQVADLARSLAYYDRVLGLRVLERHDVSAMLGADDGTPLVRLTERKGASPVPHHGRLGLYHYAILLPNRASLGRFVRHLADIGERAGSADHLVSEALYLRDPDGLGIEVYADRPRGSWRAVNRQIAMASDPLDFDDLLNAAGDERWGGMPAGTTMGHVHLHVGDLDEAASFYHVALGLDKMVWSYPSALFLAAGGYHHHLGLNTWAGPQAMRPTERDARLLEWRLVLPSAHEIQSAVDSLRSGGYSVREEDDGWIATDPWDTPVRLVTG